MIKKKVITIKSRQVLLLDPAHCATTSITPYQPKTPLGRAPKIGPRAITFEWPDPIQVQLKPQKLLGQPKNWPKISKKWPWHNHQPKLAHGQKNLAPDRPKPKSPGLKSNPHHEKYGPTQPVGTVFDKSWDQAVRMQCIYLFHLIQLSNNTSKAYLNFTELIMLS